VSDDRIPVLYLAPWVDYGGSDKGTIDWFRWLDRSRFAPLLATTQPSDNRRLGEVGAYATEVWPLPDLVAGQHMPGVIFDLIGTRGVRLLHIMNSRLGFELLPDLAALPDPPAVVVQLHVEEEDRSGYVRYVTSRFANLVDAFSVTSEHLAAAVEAYDVPRSRIHVIRTGVDAETEFSPERAWPADGLESDAFHVLYPGRLVDQKDPLLMIDVAAELAAARPEARVHVVGDGPLEPAVRELARKRGLEGSVRFHPPTHELAGWYAACDALLMTSRFEGVPYVVYEAMAMGLPVVAPALAGNVEVLGAGDAGLVEPRDDHRAYAERLAALARDPARRAEIGAAHRERARSELSVQAMADAHGELYDRLLERRPAPRRERWARSERVELPLRARGGTPLVSVVIPCFNHGRYLPECLEHVRAQTWPNLEIVVVDDASTEADTVAVLDAVEREGDVRVIRQERNGGPSRARNAGIAASRGRYVLPVDADNLLLPEAVERLVGQLSEANEQVGFVYPNLQYFGTRRDYFEAPPYNLYSLLFSNYCDTCALVDRSVYDAGLRFAEDIVLGHEDWDFALQLADRGIEGEPAHAPTVRYRKHGFTRSDTVEHGAAAFHDDIRLRHPALYGPPHAWGRIGPAADPPLAIKARWSPGLSVVALEAIEPHGEAGQRLAKRLARQSATDMELILRSRGEWPRPAVGPAARRIPAGLSSTPAEALGEALRIAKGQLALVTAGTGSDLLAHPAALEQILRIFGANDTLQAVALTDAGPAGRYPLRLLGAGEAPGAIAHAVAYRSGAGAVLPADLELDEGDPIGSIVRTLSWRPGTQWRHAPGPRAPERAGARRLERVARRPPRGSGEQLERTFQHEREPAVPSLPWDQVRRWAHAVSWTPAESMPICRHKRLDGEERRYTNRREPPPGFALEYDLGAVHRFQVPGSAELHLGGPDGFELIPEPADGGASVPGPRRPGTLGFVGQAPLPLLDALQAAFHPPSGHWVLISGPEDPLRAHVTEVRHLGFVEAFPNNPRRAPHVERRTGVIPLVRTVDLDARRHRIGLGAPAAGELSLELGGIHEEPQEGAIPIWIEDDRIVTAAPPEVPSAARRDALRWAAAPLAWRGDDAGPLPPRVRAAGRRFVTGLRGADADGPGTPAGPPAGYLLRPLEGGGRHELFAAVHPVTGDQLVTPWPIEAADMGYGEARSLGWAATVAPLRARAVAVPWASRFGRSVRRP
jgi:glycosyltransferase involved in cell wall biosynthesis